VFRARTCDPLIKSAFKSTPAGYGSYDLLASVTGCSRQRVYLLPPITSSLCVFLSQVCLKLIRMWVLRVMILIASITPDDIFDNFKY
jgi:hypothetical protein